MIKLTFDTSVRINASKETVDRSATPKTQMNVAAAIKLRRLYESKPELIEITCNDGERHKKSDNFKRTRGVGIWGLRGFSELNVSAILVGDEHARILEKIREIMRPSRSSDSSMKDYAVLCEHVVAGRDIFVSADEPKHLKKASQLRELGIIVKSAPETVAYLEQQYGFDFSDIMETP